MHGEDYEVVQVSEMFGKVSGSSVDWVYDTLNVVDAYGFELRPDINSNYGFLLPEVEVCKMLSGFQFYIYSEFGADSSFIASFEGIPVLQL